MALLYTKKKKRSRWFFMLIFLGSAALAAVFIYRAGKAAAPNTSLIPAAFEPPRSPEQQKLTALEEEISHLISTMDQFELIQNKSKYLEIVSVASEKNLEADALWEKLQASRRGLAHGLESGIFEVWDRRFTTADKVAMLSEKYGVPADVLPKLKSDIEIMFSEELSEKFGSFQEVA